MTNSEIYFNTLGQALDAAFAKATKKGFEILQDDNKFIEPCGYGQTTRESFLLVKDGKLQRKQLHIQFYRMESGTYELNSYIN